MEGEEAEKILEYGRYMSNNSIREEGLVNHGLQ
jgi:hypothetical protein